MQHLIPALDYERVTALLRSCLRENRQTYPLHEPLFEGNEWKYVKECLDTGWVSSVGRFVDEFERRLADYTGTKKAVAVVNGTAAMHMALQLVGVQAGDEVLVPALSFVATANAITYCGAAPHFADSEETTLGIDPDKVEKELEKITRVEKGVCWNKGTGRRIKALVAVHTLGHPVDLDPLLEVTKRFGIELIEDAAEAIGSFYKGRHVGQWGKVSVLSFNGNKTITTGGGGAILTHDEDLGARARHLTATAKVPHPWSFYHDEVGYNYRLPNLNAALGCAQLERLSDFLERKRNLAQRYQKAFSPLEGLRFFTEPELARSNYWLNALLLDETWIHERDPLLGHLHKNGILARPVWTLVHKLPMFRDCPRMDLSTAESLEARLINIPSGANL